MTDEILTAAQAAELLKFSEPYIKSLAAAGDIPGIFQWGEWRFIKSQLLEHYRQRAEAEQRKRQGEHRVIEIAKKAGDLAGKRGRPSKIDIAAMNEKYGGKPG